MAECIKRNCTNNNYREYKQCIFHCDKKDFFQEDIKFFWEKIRNIYVSHDRYQRIDKDIVIAEVKFPKFESYNNHSNNLNFWFYSSYARRVYEHNLNFEKCEFIDDFDLTNFYINKKLSFKNCLFRGNIKASAINELELINCEFKNELLLDNCRCVKLTISNNTKFIKDVKIHVNNHIDIKDTIFRSDFYLYGSTSLDVNIDNVQFDKELNTDTINIIKIKDTKLKSNISFNNEHFGIYLSNLTFIKDVFFDVFTNLELSDVIFSKKCIFRQKGLGKIIFSNTELNDLNLDTLNTLELNKCKLNGRLKLGNIDNSLVIKNTEIKKEVDVTKIKNIMIDKSLVFDKFCQNQECNDFILTNSQFENLDIFTSNLVKIDNTRINKKLSLSGGNYENIELNDCDIFEELNLSDGKYIKISNLNKYPIVNVLADEFVDMIINKSRISLLNAKNVPTLIINNTTIKNFKVEFLKDITFDNVKIKESCSFPKLEELEIRNSCIFYKDIEFQEIRTASILKSKFVANIKFNENIESLSINNSKLYGEVLFSNINNLVFSDSIFVEELNLSESSYSHLMIVDTTFEKNIDFKNTLVDDINIFSNLELDNSKTIFNGDIDFSFSEIKKIEIKNSVFNKNVIFNNLKGILEFNKLKDINFTDRMIINHVELKDLFKDSENVEINELSISNSTFSTNSGLMDKIGKNSIQIKDLKIDKFKLKEVSFQSDINFENLKIDTFEILNSNIEKVFRLKKCTIKEISSSDNIFEDLQIIDNRYNNNKSIQRDIKLSNTTIKSGVFDKLKFDNFSMKDAHVSEAKIGYVKYENASRETNRFFKNYYDSISDYITANIYYQKEMNEQMKDCKSWKSSEWWILFFNKWISNFGQNWIYPVLWIFLVTLVFYSIVNINLLILNGFIEHHRLWIFNDIIKFSNPFSKTSNTNYGLFYWAWMFHKLIMTVLIYHFIIAVKRKTKR